MRPQQPDHEQGRRATLSVVNFVSLDGVVQSVLSPEEDRENGFDLGGWVSDFDDPAVNALMSQTTTAAAAMLLGRKTYEGFARVWPFADDTEPAVAAMNRMPKYVASRTLSRPTWQNTTVLGPDLAGEVRRLLQVTEGTIVVFGSGELMRTLVAADLVDEYRLLVYPLVLGTGKRLFREGTPPTRLALRDAVATPRGTVISTYVRG
jgi:dihydrofolate reductase